MTGTTFDSTALRHALANVEPHAQHNGTLPALEAVRFEFDGTTLTLVATDRYTMAVETVSADEPGEPFALLLALEDVSRLSALLKGAPKNVRFWPVTLTLDGDTLTVTVPGASATCQTVPGDFPRWRGLFTRATEEATDAAKSVAHAAYDPRLVAKFAKVTVDGRKADVMRLHFAEPDKPALVEIGETFRAVLMPCRIAWAAHEPVRVAS